MADPFADMMVSLLNDARWRETVSYVPSGSAESARVEDVNVLIRRDEPAIRNEKDRVAEHRFYLKVLKTVHATHKGIVSPAIGDKWKLPIARQADGEDPEDGTYLDGWMAGAPRAARGHWLIPVTKRIFETTGGKRAAEGG
ncbi:MAG: hypothetical protein HY943_18005 [Gammaproteobacteria bacterium]|nr:hypothetical protein [Gammaproteobacteria bacterium]